MTAKPANNDNDNTQRNHKNPSPPPLHNLFQKTKRFVLRPMGLTSIILLLSVLATVFVLSQTLNLATTTSTSHPIDRRGAEEQQQQQQHQERSVINRIHTHQDDYINIDLAEDNTEMTLNNNNNNSNNDEPNPPIWPSTIQIFTPPQTPSEKQSILTTISKTSDNISQDPNTPPYQTYTSQKHFTNQRHALLFTPGTYTGLDFEVGYYVQVLGLGTKASDVVFTDCDKGPFVPSLERLSVRPPWGLGLDTFWRVAENFKTEARGGMDWIVSQAAPLRRVHVAKQQVRKHDDNGTLIKDDDNDEDDKSGSLFLGFGDAYVSGGVFANGIVEGKTDFVGQQQWISRNVEFRGEAVGGAWSLVFVGCTEGEANNNKGLCIPKASAGLDGGKSVTVEEQPNVRVEKPYIALGEDGISFVLRVPRPTWGEDAIGPDLEGETDDVRDFKRVKVAVPSEEEDPIFAAAQNTATLQKALDEEKDLVLSPGIYPLRTSLKVKHPNQVVLGLGLATLVAPTDGSPCLRVMPNTPGVRIAGIMLEASKQDVEQNFNPEMRDCPDGIASLLEWGHPDQVKTDDAGDAKNPGVLTDIFARVGGSNPDRSVSTDVMVRIHSSHVVGDNLWLWRADHVQLLPGEEANYPANPKDPNSKLPRVSDHYHQVTKDECKCATGLIVNGDDVTIHGLAVEHTEEHLTIWNGERGNVRFYQSELPYDVSHASFGAKGYTGYMVGDGVKEHDAQAVGVYSNFRDYVVKVDTAIRHPMVEEEGGGGVKKKRKLQNGADSLSSVSTGMIKNPFTVHLDNFGRIMSIVNGKGAEAEEGKGPARVKEEIVFDEDENDR